MSISALFEVMVFKFNSEHKIGAQASIFMYMTETAVNFEWDSTGLQKLVWLGYDPPGDIFTRVDCDQTKSE